MTLLPGVLLALAAAVAGAQTLRASVAVPDLDSCLAKKDVCWGLVERAYGKILRANLLEIEGALPDRFFPGQETMTFSKRGIDPQGHFLDVQCVRRGGARVPCPTERDTLEERTAMATLLSAFPRPKLPLFDEQTWALTTAGQQAVAKLRRAYPDLPRRRKGLLEASLGRRSLGAELQHSGGDGLEPDRPGFGASAPPPPEPTVSDKPVPLLR